MKRGMLIFLVVSLLVVSLVGSVSANLVAEYKFDEGLGTVVSDSSGNGNYGNLINAPSWTSGISNNALIFSGNGDYVSLTDSQLSSGFPGKSVDGELNSFSISVWAYWNSLSQPNSYSYLVSKGYSWGNSAYSLYKYWDNKIRFEIVDNNNADLNCGFFSEGTVDSGQWYHLVGVYNGSEMKIYFNGVLDNSVGCNVDIRRVASDFLIGCRVDANNCMNGVLDEIRIYDHAISNSEVLNLYENYNQTIDDPTPTIDEQAPIILSSSPSGILQSGITQTTLSVTTDEDAICKYSIISNISYDSMGNVFSFTGGTNHQINVSVFVGNNYTYYIRCSDISSNVNNFDEIISFSVDFIADIPQVSEIIFEDNFDDHPDWTIEQPSLPPIDHIAEWDESNVPIGWTSYYLEGSKCVGSVGSNSMYINQYAGYPQDTEFSFGGSGKSLTFWDESCDDNWESEAMLGVDLGEEYEEIFVRFYIKLGFKVNGNPYEALGERMHKLLWVSHWEGNGNPYYNYIQLTGTDNQPRAINGWTTSQDNYDYYNSVRCYKGDTSIDGYYCGDGDYEGIPEYNYIPWLGGDQTDFAPNLNSWLNDQNWHVIEMRYKINSYNGSNFMSDGIHQFWFDGVLVSNWTDIPYNMDGAPTSPMRKFRHVGIGGNNNNNWVTSGNTAEREQWYAIDDFVVSTEYIGPDYVIGNASYQCGDGLDNDGDSFVDYLLDPECSSLVDGSEAPVTYHVADTTQDGCVDLTEANAFVARWKNEDVDVNIGDIISMLAEYKKGCS